MSLLRIKFNNTEHPAVRFRLALISFLVGVAFSPLLGAPLAWCLGILVFIATAATSRRFGVAVAVALPLLLGIFWYKVYPPMISPGHIAYYNGGQVSFIGLVDDDPDRRTDHTKLIVRAQVVGDRAVSGRVLVNVDQVAQYQYGDTLTIRCDLAAPQPVRDFAYDRYLAMKGVYSVCRFPDVALIARGHGSAAWRAVYKVKDWLQWQINDRLPEPQASLFSAMTLGVRRGLPEDLNAAFNVTGTTHLMAISGLNMVIVATMLLHVMLLIGM